MYEPKVSAPAMTATPTLSDTARFLISGRLAIFYIAFFSVMGIQLPFWPVWLESRGLDAADIGTVMALTTGGRIIASPLFALLADRMGERKRLMIGLALGSLASFLLFGLADGFWAIFGVTLLFTIAWSPLLPLGEILVASKARETGLQYGRVRLWGSLSFIAISSTIGGLLVGRPAGTIYGVMAIAIAITAVTCLQLPEKRVPPGPGGRIRFRAFLQDRTFLLFMIAGALIQSSHGVYYAFGSLHWKSAGYSELVIGGLWGEGVLAEVILFAVGAAVSRRFQPPTLILLGGLAGMLRWTVLGLTDAMPALIAVQALHAFTFGTVHLGAVNLILQRVPSAASAMAMSLYSSVALGLATGIIMKLAGYLYGSFAAHAYFGMTLTAGLGSLFALALMRRWKTGGEGSVTTG